MARGELARENWRWVLYLMGRGPRLRSSEGASGEGTGLRTGCQQRIAIVTCVRCETRACGDHLRGSAEGRKEEHTLT
jgi:hypothetical protein